MPSFTLIIPTLGRTAELNELFESLALQDFKNFDCIVIDQNPDDRLGPMLALWSPILQIRRLRAERGASRARNLGLLHATGDLIAFPDDDCWYSAGLLSTVATWFDTYPAFSILTVGAQDRDGLPSGNRWPQDQCQIRPINAFRTTFCSSIFLRRSALHNNVRFDESIGPGTGSPWACGEETDYILNLCHQGARGYFNRSWYVGHPRRDMLSGQIDPYRAAGYGRGMGHVLRKHSLLALGAAFVVYDLIRSLLVAIRGDRTGTLLCIHHARGIVAGWRDRTTELQGRAQ